MPASFSERQAQARAAGLASAAKDPHRSQNLRRARVEHFRAEARKLHPGADENTQAGRKLIEDTAQLLERAHMAKLSAAALTARRKAREAAAKAAAAEQELAEADIELPDAG